MQKTRTKPTAPVITTKTAITQKQSQEFVQTLLHSALSNLSFLRGFFPKEAYDGRVLGSSDRLSYRDYADAKLPANKKGAKKPCHHVQILRRGRGKRADMFLDWLESTVFPAVENAELRALQIYVHPDRTDREKVVETYTFTIDYHQNEQGEAVAGIAMSRSGSQSATVESTFGSMQALLNELIKVCKDLPQLPEERFISMTLQVREEAGPETTKGFNLVTSDVLRFAEGDGWEKHTNPLMQKMSSGFHGASLRVSHLRHPAFDGFAQNHRISDQLDYPTRSSKMEDVEDQSAATERTPSTVIDSVAANPTSKTFGRSQSQVSNVPVMKTAFQGMMQPERLTQGDTQTQARATTKTLVPPTPRPGSKQLMLLPHEHSRLDENKARLIKLAKKMAKKEDDGDMVLCQCGHFENEGDMVVCSFCDTWQHLRCYGFSGRKDPRLSGTHACYQCLFSGQKEKLKTMRDLALKRRAMSIALTNGLKRKGGIAEDLGIDAKEAGIIHAYLRDEGFITPTAFSHKPGFPEQGKPFWVPIRTGPAFDTMLEVLFDPLFHVEDQYYSLQGNTPLAASKELLALMSPNMPEGATPKSKKSRRTASASTIGLDVVTDYKTPMAQGLKRGWEGDDDPASAAKRQATTLFPRLKAVQSKFILSADGQPSPANGQTV